MRGTYRRHSPFRSIRFRSVRRRFNSTWQDPCTHRQHARHRRRRHAHADRRVTDAGFRAIAAGARVPVAARLPLALPRPHRFAVTTRSSHAALHHHLLAPYRRRHVYLELLRRGHGRAGALNRTFFVSVMLHELIIFAIVREPTPWFSLFQLTQIPLIPLMRAIPRGAILGNVIVWHSTKLNHRQQRDKDLGDRSLITSVAPLTKNHYFWPI